MSRVRIALAIGLSIGLCSAAFNLWLGATGNDGTTLLRGLIVLVGALLTGLVAGLFSRGDAIKLAALAGLAFGALMVLAGLVRLLFAPPAGQPAVDSVADGLLLAVQMLAGLTLLTWLFAGLAALVAWPFARLRVGTKG